MATFPSLIPSEAPITPGGWPVTAIAGLNGSESRVCHGSRPIGGMWRPRFVNITEADYLAILAHYRGQRSGFDSFVFDPITLAVDRTPDGFAWVYAEMPQLVDGYANVITVACAFRCEPRGPAMTRGVTWRTGATVFTPGGRSGGVVYGPEVAWITASTTFTPGTRTNADALLLRMNGANNSTTFTDDGPNALTVTPFGNTRISTAQGVSGGASGYFDGSSYLQIDEGSWANLTGPSVLQACFYANSLSSSNYSAIISKDKYGTSFSWGILAKTDSILIYTANTAASVVCNVAVPTGTWNRVGLVNNPGAGLQVVLNNAIVSPANSVNLTNTTGEKVTIGCGSFNNPSFFFNGYIDDVEILKRI